MNLEFGILWIEDEYSPAEEEDLREAATNAGFVANIRNSLDGEEIEELAKEQRCYHPFDFILLDLNLAKGVKGNALAPRIRQLFPSTPILFYSGSCSEDELRQHMAHDKIEGVFCAHRTTFLKRASEIISNLAQSLNRLSGMRGLAMEVVAKTDSLCKEVVVSLHERGLVEGFDEKLAKEVVKYAQRTVDEFPKIDGLKAQLENRAVDSMKLFKVFRDSLKAAIRDMEPGEEQDRLRHLSERTRGFRDDVLECRNTLGHARETKTENGWEICDSDGKVIMTVHDFPNHRKNFLENLQAIREIHQFFVPLEAD